MSISPIPLGFGGGKHRWCGIEGSEAVVEDVGAVVDPKPSQEVGVVHRLQNRRGFEVLRRFVSHETSREMPAADRSLDRFEKIGQVREVTNFNDPEWCGEEATGAGSARTRAMKEHRSRRLFNEGEDFRRKGMPRVHASASVRNYFVTVSAMLVV